MNDQFSHEQAAASGDLKATRPEIDQIVGEIRAEQAGAPLDGPRQTGSYTLPDGKIVERRVTPDGAIETYTRGSAPRNAPKTAAEFYGIETRAPSYPQKGKVAKGIASIFRRRR